ncbi:hypothetical protein TNIN_449311 [Trichonephila inaurata madagascariensis]|uniref:Uncharacterized protein n=1 Tax=Trichonephila inaurata madagascariensis TaxID=2747483 RepID=A0A8X6Y5G7_9ARAC|nr:hypothetical protein TNIN_101981 [Trichonephila inaurata madagascariensis]GFY75817.1 hypothetical protein TNIN_449311 [Trichonephila inaurata madagascariensis]
MEDANSWTRRSSHHRHNNDWIYENNLDVIPTTTNHPHFVRIECSKIKLFYLHNHRTNASFLSLPSKQQRNGIFCHLDRERGKNKAPVPLESAFAQKLACSHEMIQNLLAEIFCASLFYSKGSNRESPS